MVATKPMSESEDNTDLSALAGQQLKISFTPHLLPISRGILSTVYCTLAPGFDRQRIDELYRQPYRDEPFIRLLAEDAFPATQQVRGSNYCDVSYKIDPATNRIIVMSAIDNVVKGASGQAVQNMNLMCGFEETTGGGQDGEGGEPGDPGFGDAARDWQRYQRAWRRR